MLNICHLFQCLSDLIPRHSNLVPSGGAVLGMILISFSLFYDLLFLLTFETHFGHNVPLQLSLSNSTSFTSFLILHQTCPNDTAFSGVKEGRGGYE